MLQLASQSSALSRRVRHVPDEERGTEFFDLGSIAAAVRRQARLAGLFALGGLIIGVIYVTTSVPLFTASTSIIIDRRQARAVQEISGIPDLGGEAQVIFDSQVEVLKSDKIALAVIEQLRLTEDRAFLSADGWLFTSILKTVQRALSGFLAQLSPPAVSNPKEQAFRLERATVSKLVNNLSVGRVGRTYVLAISFTSPDPDKATQVANAYADAYVRDQLDAKYESTRRASTWLQARLDELRQRSVETDLAVQGFRAENNLIAPGGRLISDQQLTELTSQLSLAKAEQGRTEARLQRIRAIVNSRQKEAIVTDALDNAIINQLRSKYLDVSRREAEITSRLGRDHERAGRLRTEMREYERLMFEELNRIAEGYQSDFDVASARVENLTQSLHSLSSVAARANDKLVALRGLEREADSFRNIHQSYLQRFQETLQQQSFPVSEARVITSAVRPLKPGHPKTELMLVIWVVAGSIFGGACGAIREYRDRGFRTGEQVRRKLSLEFLGVLPKIVGRDVVDGRNRFGLAKAGSSELSPALLRHALDVPMSEFAETLRALTLCADAAVPGQKTKIVGVISVLPGEGKTLVAKNWASLLAKEGSKTLLVDADLRSPSLTKAVAPEATAGLLELINRTQPMGEVLQVEQESGLAIIPAVMREQFAHPSRAIASPAMQALLDAACGVFEYIVLDLPPLGPVVDARAVASKVDAFILVVEWGRTSQKLVASTLEANELLRGKCIGVVLNKVEMGTLKFYDDYPADKREYMWNSAVNRRCDSAG